MGLLITYDARNRLKKINGDMNEYWYDPDNNRINMYYYHTNMQYLYDCSGGRSRLIWTSDHNENVTSYFYGAEGLLWSRCNDAYMIYHYDYRGSVVAVTDIDGNVTDTLKYDAYGSVIERTGKSYKNYFLAGFFIGVFRRGNKPSFLPREEKIAELQTKRASFMQAQMLLKPCLKISDNIRRYSVTRLRVAVHVVR